METPDRKVAVGAGMGGLAAMTAWGINAFTGVVVPAEVAVAFSTFLSFIVQYFVPNPK